MEVQVANQFFNVTSPYIVLQLDNVPPETSLYSLMQKTQSFNTVVGIARQADYQQKRLGNKVYFICVNTVEATFMEQQHINFIEGRDAQSLVMIDAEISSAKLPARESTSHYAHDPITVHVNGLKRCKARDSVPAHLLDLLSHFSMNGDITSILINYDRRHKCTKNDGFITFISHQQAKSVATIDMATQHRLASGRKVKTRFNHNVPIIIPIENQGLLNGVNTKLSSALEAVNMLQIRLRPPRTRHRAVSVADREPAVQVGSVNAPERRVEVLPSPSSNIPQVIRLPINPEQIAAISRESTATSVSARTVRMNQPSTSSAVGIDEMSTQAVRNKHGATSDFQLGYTFENEADEEYFRDMMQSRKTLPDEAQRLDIMCPPQDGLLLCDDAEDWDMESEEPSRVI